MSFNMTHMWIQLVRFLIRGYQICVSPFFGSRCRFFPSCSQYAEEAIVQHGFLKGSVKIATRILKCHPFHTGGYDPVLK